MNSYESLKTIRIPVEVKKHVSHGSTASTNTSLEDQIVHQLMNYSEDAVVKGYLSLHVPLPPNLVNYSKDFSTDPQTLEQFMSDSNPRIETCKPRHQDRQHQHEIKRVSASIKSQVEKQSQPENKVDKSQWIARAMKRNPHILALLERSRPLNNQPSLSMIKPRQSSTNSSQPTSETNSPRSTASPTVATDHNPGGTVNMDLLSSKGRDSMKSSLTESPNSSSHNLLKYMSAVQVDQQIVTNIEEKKSILDYSTFLGTVENKEVLPREGLLQIIYQFMAQKGYYNTIKEMEKETGIKYNGFRSEKASNRDTLMETLLSLGIQDAENPYQLPPSDFVNVNKDSEIPTASIHHHYDPKFVKEMQIPLWEELAQSDEDSIVMEGKEVKAATLNRLIEMVTSTEADTKIGIQSFLVTYRSFTDPGILLKKLCERYQVPNRIPSSERIQIQLRTSAVFIKWIEDYFSWDWNDNMIYEFLLFIDKYIMKDKKIVGDKLKQKLAQKLVFKSKDNTLVFSEQFIYPEVPKNVFSSKLSIWDIKDEELAKQLTFMDHNIYRNIEPHELLDCAWSKANLRHRAKNILQSISYVETLSNWLECQIVREESLRERKMKLSRLMKLAILMNKLNNFNSLMALSSTFNKSSVHRLKFTIAEIDETLKKEFDEAIAIVDPKKQKNYSTLRNHIKKVAKPPLNVFLGVYQTDLIMIEEGNPDFTSNSNERTLINWKKRRLVATTISEVMDFKNPPYNIRPVQQIQELLRTTFENHDITDVYDISMQVEPRNTVRKEDLVP
ncbi:rasGEF domain-containing protein [Naegleria gruberi]|uniref:RasGEF domain-containing protein n=1 Tax=Naegleria gruberi TaxID=5762 RepID=D2VGL2_NAEGR|nr:rasGEF domain-containing protein [Naegleria gruberi]EFC43984.1 rasGEF domain-containing protein [Naegleria gruberi]|eukprot:XP_002676728.1 rasGEF domain-containing protein [Naegleria gruberi strain NEG-M]